MTKQKTFKEKGVVRKVTPKEFISIVKSNITSGFVDVQEGNGFYGVPSKIITMVTAGSSLDEEVIYAIEKKSLFGTLYWYKSKRGGTVVFHVPVEQWDSLEMVWYDGQNQS